MSELSEERGTWNREPRSISSSMEVMVCNHQSKDIEKGNTRNEENQPTWAELYKRNFSVLDTFCTGLLLCVSSATLVINLPAYTSSTMGTPISYLFISSFATITIGLCVFIIRSLGCMDRDRICHLTLSRLLQIVFTFGTGCMLLFYCQHEKRLPCHLQNTMKTMLLPCIVALYYYSCKKVMSLMSFFGVLAVSIGVLTSLHYSLCRGLKDKHESSWQIQALWTVLYCFGLAILGSSYVLMENYIVVHLLKMLFQPSGGSPLMQVTEIVNTDDPAVSECRCEPPSQCSGNVISMSNERLANHCFYVEMGKHQRNVCPNNLYTVPRLTPRHSALVHANTIFKKLVHSSIFITMWIQGFVTLVFFIVAAIQYIAFISGIITNQYGLGNVRPDAALLVCHNPALTSSDQLYHYDNNTFQKATDIVNKWSTKFVAMDYSIALEKKHDQDYSMERSAIDPIPISKRSAMMDNTKDLHYKNNGKWYRTKYAKKWNKTLVPLRELNDTMKKNLFDNRCNKSAKVVLVKSQKIIPKRNKRTSVQTNALGFKIIQPTDSILQGHVITNKLKPALIGHVILNKTNVNLNGHRITFKQDLFIREHDPQPSKMHRMHRGRPDTRFLNDLINSTIDNGSNKTIESNNGDSNDNASKITRVKRSIMSNNMSEMNEMKHNAKSNNIDPIEGDNSMKSKNRKAIANSFTLKKMLERHNESVVNDEKRGENETMINNQEYVPENINPDKNIDIKTSNNEPIIAETLKTLTKDKTYLTKATKPIAEKYMSYDKSPLTHLKIPLTTMTSPNNHTQFDQKIDCGHIAFYGWSMAFAYTTFIITSTRFLILSQSSIFTLAIMSTALPISQLYYLITIDESVLNIQPNISTQFISVILGILLIVIGLYTLFRDHFTRIHMYTVISPRIVLDIGNDHDRVIATL